MRIDKVMIAKDAKRCLASSGSFLLAASRDLDAKKTLDLRSALRAFGDDAIVRSFPRRVLAKVLHEENSQHLPEVSGAGIIFAGMKEGGDIAGLARSLAESNKKFNVGVREDKKDYIKIIAGLIEGEFYGIDRAHVLETLVTLDDARARVLAMIGSPMSYIIGMIGEQAK